MENMSIIVRNCRNFAEKKLKEFDLTFGEQVIIMFLSIHKNVNQDTISKRYMVDKCMVAKILNKLEHKGIIVRARNPNNKRENLISLSQKGSDMIKHMGSILKEWNEIIYDGFSPEEVECMKRLTEKMALNIANNMELIKEDLM